MKAKFSAGIALAMVSGLFHLNAFAGGYSDDVGGRVIENYTVGFNLIGTRDVLIFPPDGERFDDPAGCAGATSPAAVLADTADENYKLVLVQIISAAATRQKVSFFLSDECYNIGYGAQRPIVTGIRVYPAS